MADQLNLEAYHVRTELIREVRRFFEEQSFAEVIPQILNRSVPLEPNIHTFHTQWHAGRPSDLFLSTSPERTMKYFLARGIGPCFSIGKCFRNLEGAGSRHNPEYLMLEWYRLNTGYRAIIADMKHLIEAIQVRINQFKNNPADEPLSYQGSAIDLHQEWQEIRVLEAMAEILDIEPADVVNDQALITAAANRGYTTENASWHELYDQILVQEIESTITMQPTVVTQHPARTSPLCSVVPDFPQAAERFEVYLGGIEIANGNNEETDPDRVRTLFTKHHAELTNRAHHDRVIPPIDESFLTSLAQMRASGDTFAGVGLGIDRLAMVFADVSSITAIEPRLP